MLLFVFRKTIAGWEGATVQEAWISTTANPTEQKQDARLAATSEFHQQPRKTQL